MDHKHACENQENKPFCHENKVEIEQNLEKTRLAVTLSEGPPEAQQSGRAQSRRGMQGNRKRKSKKKPKKTQR